MVTIHVNGTQLARPKPSLPLNRRFIAALAVMFLLAMHFFMPNPGGAGLSLSFNALVWSVLSFALAIGCYQLANNRQLRYSKLTIGLFISCLIMTVPVLYANAHIENAIGRLLALWTGLLFFVVLQQFLFTNRQRQGLLWLIILAVLIETLLAYYQYFFAEPGNFLGYNTKVNRPYGIFQQPNVMASFLATGIALSGYLLARQPLKYNKHRGEMFILYLVPLLAVPILVVLASRTGWLGAIWAVGFLLPYLYRFAGRLRCLLWVAAILAGVAFGSSCLHNAHPDANMSESLSLRKLNIHSPRQYTFPQALDMLIEKPLTGYGYGNFESQYILYTARQHLLNHHYPAGLPGMDHPHNEFLFWGVEGGLLPILGMFIAMCMVLHRIYSARNGTRLATFSLLIPIFLHSQLEYPFYHSAIHWLIFIILLFWIDQRVARYRSVGFSSFTKTTLRILSLLAPVLVCFYMLTSLQSNYVLNKFEHSRHKNLNDLREVTNPISWKQRLNWDIYATYLNAGLTKGDPTLIHPYINWSLSVIKNHPRPVFYRNLILAYQGLNDTSKAEQVRSEAKFLFPKYDFSKIQYHAPSKASSGTQLEKTNK